MAKTKENPICGIVMPISSIDGCSEGHWSEVQAILAEAIEKADFKGTLVSTSDEVGVIHKRIVQNLYDNPIVVCDVSGKNPNVMFELGLRLAFDKPTIIVKDDQTPYSFDTSAIEHLEYPRDLRFSQIVEFKDKLTSKLLATYKKSQEGGDYTTFLKHFGEFKIAKIDKKEVSSQEYILDELSSLKRLIFRLDRNISPRQHKFPDRWPEDDELDICTYEFEGYELSKIEEEALLHPFVEGVTIRKISNNHSHVVAKLSPNTSEASVRADLHKALPSKGGALSKISDYNRKRKAAEKNRQEFKDE